VTDCLLTTESVTSQPWSQAYRIDLLVEDEPCTAMRMLRDRGIQDYRYLDIRISPDGSVNHMVQVLGNPPAESSTNSECYNCAWVESESCKACRTILSHGASQLSGRNFAASTIMYSFLAPDFSSFKVTLSDLERMDLKAKVMRLEMLARSKLLTEKQEEALWSGLRKGLFDYPRSIRPSELAHELGVSPSALSEILRRGMRRLLEAHYQSN